MSYEAVVAAAEGDEATMAKSFIIIARDIAQSWYNNLQSGSVTSWGDHRDKVCTNFKGVTRTPINPIDLFNYRQGEREPLQRDVVGSLPRGMPTIVDYRWRCTRQ
jgi:hypothetical protein